MSIGNLRAGRLSEPSMAVVRSVPWLAASVALIGLLACERASRGGDAGSVAPGQSAEDAGHGAAGVEASPVTGSEQPASPEAVVEHARRLHANALAEGDAAEQARARFALAEAYVSAAAGLDVARFDLQAERAADPARSLADLERSEAELVARQAAWLEAAAIEYAEVIRATDPTALELRPQARYWLADLERRRGNRTAMNDALVVLVRDHPTHPLVASAYAMLADEAFEDGRFEAARELYEKVVVLGSDHKHYARYKLGWVAFNLDDGQGALAHWVSVATEARADPRQQALVESAVSDCVIAYARVGRPERARAFFNHLDPSRTDELLRRLAEIYRQEGRPDDAARALGTAP
jgi:tetratricopeptide (TPR) repeat protein